MMQIYCFKCKRYTEIKVRIFHVVLIVKKCSKPSAMNAMEKNRMGRQFIYIIINQINNK